MRTKIRFLLVLAIFGLFAAALVTWEPSQDGAIDPNSPSGKIVSVLDRWSEQVPSLKDDLQEFTANLKEKLSGWTNSATEQTSFFSDMSLEQFTGEEKTGTKSLTTLLSQLKGQLKGVNMEDLQKQVQDLIEKAKTVDDTSMDTAEEPVTAP